MCAKKKYQNQKRNIRTEKEISEPKKKSSRYLALTERDGVEFGVKALVVGKFE